MSEQQISSVSERKYFTMLPNIVDEYDLDPYEFRLLVHYYRVGNCWESTRTTAKLCKMSHPTVINKRRSLEEKGLITTSVSDQDTVLVELVDLWPANMERYGGSEITSSGNDVYTGGSHVYRGGSEVYTKNNQLRKTNNKNNTTASPSGEDVAFMVRAFSELTGISPPVPQDKREHSAFQLRWRSPLRRMGAYPDFQHRLKRAVDYMRDNKLLINAPASVEKVFIGLAAEKSYDEMMLEHLNR